MDLCASEGPKTASTGDSGLRGVDLTVPSSATDKAGTASLPSQVDLTHPRHLCIHQLLEDSFARNLQAIAVEFQAESLTYAELDVRSNQLARRLVRKGAGPDVSIGLCVERSLEMVVALLGILKAGSAYVPLDPSYPSDRIKYVLDDAKVKILVTQSSLVASLPPTSAEIVRVDPGFLDFQLEDSAPVVTPVRPDNLAYVIYTSGSTGRPKGVQIEHCSVVNFLCSMLRHPGMTASDVLVAVTTLAFDIAGLEIYLPLLAGGKLVVASREATMDGRLLIRLLDRSEATIMQATPTTWRVLLESRWEGDLGLKVLVGGEALSADLANQLAHRCASVWNMYGPTETTIWSSVYKVEGNDPKLVPIGKPIANTAFYILDARREPVPDGAEGELYIGGEGLARGYFERAELTAEKFVLDPFGAPPTARMYRTGDLARRKQDGNLEFLGRIDHQVKIRGFRIELGEIEAVLEQHDGVKQAVVIAREDSTDDKRLVVYFVPNLPNSPRSADLREHVGRQLPDYMIPDVFVEMATLPLTPNGKVDRKALPTPNPDDFESSSEYVAPRNETERKLVQLWEDVLGISPISVTANFFDLGGRSVLAARLFTKVLRAFGKELPLSTLFRSPTVELLALELRSGHGSAEYQTVIPIRKGGSLPPFFCVHGGAGSTLFLHQLANGLESARPFYGIEPEGLNGRPFQRVTVEEMAAHYLGEIRKVQPKGPYYLGGYCFGGLVAFEMARMLEQQGEKSALVALFSAGLRFHRHVPTSTAPITGEASAGSRWMRLLASPVQTGRSLSSAIYWWVSDRLRWTSYRILFGFGLPLPPGMRTMYVMEKLNQAERNYIPAPYSGTVVLFYGSGSFDLGPNLGWDGLAESLEHRVIGDGILESRRDIMNEPLVEITARELAPYLNGECGERSRPGSLSAK